jgi:hypothetical protein
LSSTRWNLRTALSIPPTKKKKLILTSLVRFHYM